MVGFLFAATAGLKTLCVRPPVRPGVIVMSKLEDELSFLQNSDSAMPSLIEHWRLSRRVVEVPFTLVPTAELLQPSEVASPDVLLQATVVTLGDPAHEGRLVAGVAIAWFEIIAQLERDPEFLFRIPWRKLEEMIAGAYEEAGWSEVVLTPRSADSGRDVIATRTGLGSIRIIDQIKAYKPGHVVTADEIRSMLGVLQADHNVSKGLVTTTSSFAPGIQRDHRLQAFMPYRLELKDGPQLRQWLFEIVDSSSRAKGPKDDRR